MGLLDSLYGGQGGGLLDALLYRSPLQNPPDVQQPQYDAMGNYTGITPQAQSPFPMPQQSMPSPAQFQQPSPFNAGAQAPAFQQFAGVPTGPQSQAPQQAPEPPPADNGPSGYMNVGGYQMPQFGPRELYQPQQAQLPPNATPTQGQMQAAQTPPVFMQPPSPGGLGGAARGFLANAHTGPIGAILGAVTGGAGMGQGNPQEAARQNLRAQFEAYKAAGLSPEKAMLATLNPKIGEEFMKPKFEKLGAGETLVSVGGHGGGASTVASGGPEKPTAGYEYADPKDPSKGWKAIAGGPGTHLPAETAGRLALMDAAAVGLPDARKVLMQGRGAQGTGISGAAASYSNVGETGRAQRTVRAAVEGALRAMTGANAPEPEVKRYENMFMPGPLDSTETAKQKLDLLDAFLSNAKQMVTQGRGPAATPSASAAPSAVRIYNPTTGKIE